MNYFLVFLRGFLLLRISGQGLIRFLNLCKFQNIYVWNIRYEKQGLRLCSYVSDYVKICQLCKKSNCRIHIVAKIGLPFQKKYITRKAGFLFGLFLYLCGMWCASRYVWGITFEGNWQISTEQLSDELRRLHIHEGIQKNQINLTRTEETIRDDFPRITWICAKYIGNVLTISLEENLLVDYSRQSENDFASMRLFSEQAENDSDSEPNITGDIYADQSGIISYMVVRAGTAMCKIGDQVEKGELLVKGSVSINQPDGSVLEQFLTHADADIYLDYKIPLQETYAVYATRKQYTSRSQRAYGLLYNGKVVISPDWMDPFLHPFPKEDRIERKTVILLPFFQNQTMILWERERKEYEYIYEKITSEEATAYFTTKLMYFIESLEGKGVQIIEKDVKMENDGFQYTMQGELHCIGPVMDGNTGDY